MKKLYFFGFALVLSTVAFAQVPRVPMIEIFSSSTCPPCKPASDIYNPLIEDFQGQVAVVKYSMSWPGAGDPYFTPEGGERRTFYNVSGVPNIYVNGVEVSHSAFNTAYFEDLVDQEAYMELEVKYYVSEDDKRVYYAASMDSDDNFSGGDYRLFMTINEKVTYENATSNGETEFHHIFKKMLPTSQGSMGIELGDSIITGFQLDTADYFEFKGQYRLPPNAQDPVDIATEHTVEEFEDLEMMMWVQNMTTKEVVQAAVGVKVGSLDELGFEEAPIDGTDPRNWPIGVNEVTELAFEIFPNPTKERLNVRLNSVSDFTVVMTDLLGKEVKREAFTSKNNVVLSVDDLPKGVYMIQFNTDTRTYFDRVVIK